MPLSLISTQSVAALGALVGSELDPRRFRPNLLIEASEPFEEETWVGRVLRVGGMRMRVDQQDERCVIVTVDPVTSERNPAVLRAIAQQRDDLHRGLRVDRDARGASPSATRSSSRMAPRRGSARGRWSAPGPGRAPRSRGA